MEKLWSDRLATIRRRMNTVFSLVTRVPVVVCMYVSMYASSIYRLAYD